MGAAFTWLTRPQSLVGDAFSVCAPPRGLCHLLTRRARRVGRSGAIPDSRRKMTLESVSVGALVERIGRVSEARMREICGALEVATDCR